MLDKTLIDFHVSNGFFVKAQRLKKANGCFIEYPRSIITNRVVEPFITCYFAEPKKIKIMSEKEKGNGKSKEIEVPDYAIRSLIAEDVLIQLQKLKLHHDIVFCFDRDGTMIEDVSNLVSLIDPPLEADDRAKEQALLVLLGEILLGLDNSHQARQEGIEEGYKMTKRVFDNGGLYNV